MNNPSALDPTTQQLGNCITNYAFNLDGKDSDKVETLSKLHKILKSLETLKKSISQKPKN
jgi:hypothetical protein